MSALATLTPAEEERRAREQHRHMQRMRREADRARERRESAAKRAHRRQVRARLDEAERRAGAACREYNRLLSKVSDRANLTPELSREWDRAYSKAIGACAHATRIRRELEDLGCKGPEMTPDEMQRLYELFIGQDGDTIRLEAHRDAVAVARDGHESHISTEAFDRLVAQARLWIGTRMIRFHERTGRGAHDVTLELTVRTTGPLEPGGEPHGRVKLLVIDGQMQLEAIRP